MIVVARMTAWWVCYILHVQLTLQHDYVEKVLMMSMLGDEMYDERKNCEVMLSLHPDKLNDFIVTISKV